METIHYPISTTSSLSLRPLPRQQEPEDPALQAHPPAQPQHNPLPPSHARLINSVPTSVIKYIQESGGHHLGIIAMRTFLVVFLNSPLSSFLSTSHSYLTPCSSNLAASESPSTQHREPTMSLVGSAGDVGYTLGEHSKTHSGSWSGSALLLAVDDETLVGGEGGGEGRR